MRVPSWTGLTPLLAFILLFAALPVAVLFSTGVLSGNGAAGLSSALESPLGVRAIENSLEQGALSAAFATLLGYPAGIAISRWEFPGRSVLRALLPVPFLLPSLVVIFGALELFGPGGLLSAPIPAFGVLSHGIPGILVVNVAFNAPMVALLTSSATSQAPAAPEEAVLLLGGGPLRAYREVWGPASALGALAGALLTFLFSALAFAAPLVVCGARCYTVEARVFVLAQVLAQPSAAADLALWGVLVFAIPAAIYAIAVSTVRRRGSGRTRPPRPIRGAGWRAIPFLTALGALVAGEMVLLGSVLLRGIVGSRGTVGEGLASLFQPSTTHRVGIPTAAALGNTLLFGALAAGFVLLLSIGAAGALRRRVRTAVLVEIALFVPLLVSPVLLAFSLATVWRPVLGGEDGVWILIVVSQTMLGLPLAFPQVRLALSRLGSAPSDAATCLGAGPTLAYLEVDLPRIARSLGSATLLALAVGIGEFTATYFLFIPRYTTLPVELYLLQSVRLPAESAALAAILLLTSLVAFLAVELGGRRLAV